MCPSRRQVNDESVEDVATAQIIDLLRIIRGAICLTVLRSSNSSRADGESDKAAAVEDVDEEGSAN